MPLSSGQFAQLAMLLLARRSASVIAAEDDKRTALRKALLVLMALTQDEPTPAAKDFVRFLVTEFAPLVAHLHHGDHALWEKYTLGVRQNHVGDIVLAIKRSVIDALIEEFGTADSAVQKDLMDTLAVETDDSDAAGEWPITDRRYVGLFDVMGREDIKGEGSAAGVRALRGRPPLQPFCNLGRLGHLGVQGVSR